MRKSYRLTYLDEKGEINLHSEQWRHIFELVLDGYASGAFAPLLQFGGKQIEYAMSMSTGTMNCPNLDKYGFVTVPGSPDSMKAPYFSVYEIDSVSSTTEHPEAAMEFIKFIHSDEVAQTNMNFTNGIPARINIIPDAKKVEMAPFLAYEIDLELLMRDEIDWLRVMSGTLYTAFGKYLERKISLDEAISLIEKEAGAELEKLRINQRKEVDIGNVTD